jgi:MFS family permease
MGVHFFEKDFRAFFLVIFTSRRMFHPDSFGVLPHVPGSDRGRNRVLYSGMGYFASFALNVPAGMFADRFGYKRTIVFTKLLLIASSASFLFAESFYGFLMGAVFNALGQRRVFKRNRVVVFSGPFSRRWDGKKNTRKSYPRSRATFRSFQSD